MYLKQANRLNRLLISGFLFLAMALTLPNFAFGELEYNDERYAVYDHQTRSYLPTDGWCSNSSDPACEDTSLVAWKFGPIKINDTNNKWGDAAFYQLQETYTINLADYLGPNSLFIAEVPICVNLDNRLYWYYELPDYLADDEIELSGLMLTIQRGYRWDGPSIEVPPNIPWWLQLFVAPKHRLAAKPFGEMRASLVHDALYEFPRRELISPDYCSPGDASCHNEPEAERGRMFRQMADCILYTLSRQDGLEKAQAKSEYDVIRFGGAGYTDPAINELPIWKYHATADAGPDQVVECATSTGGADVALDGTGTTFPPNYTSRIFQWDFGSGMSTDPLARGLRQPIVNFLPDVHIVTLMVDDGNDFFYGPWADNDKVTITVKEDIEAPQISNPGDILAVNEPGQCSARVYFSLSSIDNCEEPALSCTHAAGEAFPVGQTNVQCEAEDSNGNTAETEFSITVEDTEAPEINGVAGPIYLWEPSHGYVTLTIADFVHVVSDNCTSLTPDDLVIIGVASNEPDDGKGDGRTTDDFVIAADGKSVDLRAERRGKGAGRTYTVDIQAVDEYGNATSASFEVTVSHNKS